MAKKIVIKVSIKCDKEKTSILKAVAKLQGINEVSMDAEKGTLTVIGDADPVCIIASLRKKCGRCVEIDTVGPPKPPEKKDEKKDDKKECPCPKCKTCHPCKTCPPCQPPCPPCKPPCPPPYPYCYEYDTPTCSIL